MSNSEVCEDREQLVSAEDEKDFSRTIKTIEMTVEKSAR